MAEPDSRCRRDPTPSYSGRPEQALIELDETLLYLCDRFQRVAVTNSNGWEQRWHPLREEWVIIAASPGTALAWRTTWRISIVSVAGTGVRGGLLPVPGKFTAQASSASRRLFAEPDA
jgi:hypothetical protein